MGKILDFNCGYDNSMGLTKKIAKETQLSFPEAYQKAETMVTLSKALKGEEGADYCQLPFCHTVEGEALGGEVNLGDEKIGPRAKGYRFTTPEEILALPEIDYSTGRIAEVLKACKILRDQEEKVVLYVSGPFTMLNVLIEPRYVFKTFKKKPKIMQAIFDKLRGEILRFVKEGEKVGVKLISYGDSSGGINILGPKFTEETVNRFTYPLLKELDKELDRDTLVLLCPKTTYSLLGLEKARWREMDLGAPMKYAQGWIEVMGRTRFVGEMCINNKNYELHSGVMKTVELVE